MIVLGIGFMFFIAACDGPTSGFRDAKSNQQIVGDNRFTVYVGDGYAEAIRTNPTFNIRMPTIARDAAVAMQKASGCRVRELAGDAAIVTGRLSCTGPEAPACEVQAVLKGRRGFQVPITGACDRSGG